MCYSATIISQGVYHQLRSGNVRIGLVTTQGDGLSATGESLLQLRTHGHKAFESRHVKPGDAADRVGPLVEHAGAPCR